MAIIIKKMNLLMRKSPHAILSTFSLNTSITKYRTISINMMRPKRLSLNQSFIYQPNNYPLVPIYEKAYHVLKSVPSRVENIDLDHEQLMNINVFHRKKYAFSLEYTKYDIYYFKMIITVFCLTIAYIIKSLIAYEVWPKIYALDKPSIRKTSNFIADAVEDVLPSVVHIGSIGSFQNDSSNGSGFIIHEDGLILTNAHVVANRNHIRVHLHDGSVEVGKVYALDPISDLAMIKINKKSLKCLKLGDSSSLRAGEWVIALGSPLSLSKTVTSGIVSSTGRKCVELGIHNKNIDYIQTDALITFGHSGGPLINLDGEVIGINTLTVTTGISFAIPIDYVKLFISKVKESEDGYSGGKVTHAKTVAKQRYIGVTMLTLTPEIVVEIRSKVNLPLDVNSGVYINKVCVGSPAHKGGFRVSDIVTEIEGKSIRTTAEVFRAVAKQDVIDFTVLRNGTRVHIKVFPEQIGN